MPAIFGKSGFSKELVLAVTAAKEAGQAILPLYHKGVVVETKKDHSPVTKADRLSHHVIKTVLSKSGYSVLSEEEEVDTTQLNAPFLWIVDPLDGTSNFIHTNEEFAVLIGLVCGHEPILGVIYQPATEHLFIAEKGRGAFAHINNEWQLLRMGKKENADTLDVVMSRHHVSVHEIDFLKYLGIEDYTRQGSAGLKIAAVASGKADAYFTMTDKLRQWDTCAGYCLIQEAGGCITDLSGTALSYNSIPLHHQNGLLVANHKLHDMLLDRFQQYSARTI